MIECQEFSATIPARSLQQFTIVLIASYETVDEKKVYSGYDLYIKETGAKVFYDAGTFFLKDKGCALRVGIAERDFLPAKNAVESLIASGRR